MSCSLLEIPVEKSVKNRLLIRQRHNPQISVPVFRDSTPETKSPISLSIHVFFRRHNLLAPFISYIWSLCQNIIFKVARTYALTLLEN